MNKLPVYVLALVFLFVGCQMAPVESVDNSTTQPTSTTEVQESTETPSTQTGNESPDEDEQEETTPTPVLRTMATGFHGFVYLGEYECREGGTRHTLVLNPTSIIYDGVEYTYVQYRQYNINENVVSPWKYYLIRNSNQYYYFAALRTDGGNYVNTKLEAVSVDTLPSEIPTIANYRVFGPVVETSGSTSSTSTPTAVDLSWSVDVEGYVISTDSATGRVLTVTSNGYSWVAITHSKVSENASNSTRRLTFANEALGRQLIFRHVDNNVLFITETVNGTTTTYQINEYLNYQTDHWSAFDVLYPQITW